MSAVRLTPPMAAREVLELPANCFSNLVKLFQRRGLHGIERGNAQQNVQAHLVIEVSDHFSGHVRIQIGYNDGLNLRVLEANDICHCSRLHPLQAIKARGAAAEQNAVNQTVGLVLAKGLGQHAADITVGANTQTGLIADHLDEIAHDLLHLLAMHGAQTGHGAAHPLNFLGAHVLENGCSVGLAKAEQKDGRLVQLGHLGRALTRFFTHRH